LLERRDRLAVAVSSLDPPVRRGPQYHCRELPAPLAAGDTAMDESFFRVTGAGPGVVHVHCDARRSAPWT